MDDNFAGSKEGDYYAATVVCFLVRYGMDEGFIVAQGKCSQKKEAVEVFVLYA